MNILDAMADQKLFGKTFRRGLLRGDSWKAWRGFLGSLFGLELDAEARALFELHTGRTDFPAQQFSEAFCICGRRSGKSIIAALVAIFLACFRDYSDVLAPGEVGVLPIIAPDRKQCRVILNYIVGFFESSPTLAKMVKIRLKESIELTNNIRIEVHTASFRTVRGYTAIGCILDEVAFLPTDDSANPASELIAAIMPAMSTIPDALLLAISSPYARRGVLWETYKEHFGKSGSPVLVWQAETRAMNPTVSRLVIDAAYLRDRAAASAEYGAQFRTDIESFLDIEVVEARVQSGRLELPPNSAHSYFGFCDPSGGRADSFSLAVAHEQDGVAVLDCLREIMAPFSPENACAELADTLKRYGLSEVTGDRYAGEWPREAFQKHGVAYRVAERTRSELYLELLPALTSGQAELLDHRRLITQLVSLERRTARSGKDSIDHAPGAHDDVANSAAGAIVGALGGAAGVFGVIDYYQGPLAAKQIQAEAAPRRRTAMARPATAVPECPRCQSTCTTAIAGVPHRCNACGAQFGDLPDAPHVTRGDVLSGKVHARTRRFGA